MSEHLIEKGQHHNDLRKQVLATVPGLENSRLNLSNVVGVHEYHGGDVDVVLHFTRSGGRPVAPCGCACCYGGFCGGCGHAGCGRQ